VSEKSHGKRVKVPVDSIPEARTWLPDPALGSGVPNWGRERAYGVHTTAAQDVKMEISGKDEFTIYSHHVSADILMDDHPA
jgi:hypothetical protein